MLSRFVAALKSNRPTTINKPIVEKMEQRLLFAAAPRVTSITPDNRGEVMITFDQALDPSTVKSTTVQVHTAGADGVFGTADDVKIDGIVRLKTGNKRIWWRPRVAVPFAADTTYSVKVSGKLVKAADGVTRIDGEFNGPGVASGDGVGGGDLLFLAKRDKSASPTARFSTVEGNIDVSLDTVNTPLTYANFLHYADNGLWDYTFFHRDVPGFVIQGGGFNASLTDNTAAGLSEIPTISPVVNEFHTSNTRGTIAMAKVDGNVNSATDQWFFNEVDNGSNLDGQNGGFTVFGTVKNASSLAVMDQIAALPTDALQNAGHDPQGLSIPDPTTQQSLLDATPVIHAPTTPAALDPINDLMIVRRVAILDKYVAFPTPT